MCSARIHIRKNSGDVPFWPSGRDCRKVAPMLLRRLKPPQSLTPGTARETLPRSLPRRMGRHDIVTPSIASLTEGEFFTTAVDKTVDKHVRIGGELCHACAATSCLKKWHRRRSGGNKSDDNLTTESKSRSNFKFRHRPEVGT
jgi:hypothetical protein